MDLLTCCCLKLVNEFEYIPVQGGPFCMHAHNPTPYDTSTFLFDNIDHRPCPLLHFRASHIALMVEAQPHLSTVTRLKTPKGDIAELQIATLLRLYARKPGPSSLISSISVPSEYEALRMQLEQPNTQPRARPSSPPIMNAPARSISFAKDPMPGLTPGSSAFTDHLPQTEDADVGPYAGDVQLAEYAKEPSVTWEDLKNRPPLFGGVDQGPWRFASADDICRDRSKWL